MVFSHFHVVGLLSRRCPIYTLVVFVCRQWSFADCTLAQSAGDSTCNLLPNGVDQI